MSLKLSFPLSLSLSRHTSTHTAQAFIYTFHAYRIYNNTKRSLTRLKRLSKTKDSQSGSQSISAHTSSFRGNFFERKWEPTQNRRPFLQDLFAREDERSCFSLGKSNIYLSYHCNPGNIFTKSNKNSTASFFANLFSCTQIYRHTLKINSVIQS